MGSTWGSIHETMSRVTFTVIAVLAIAAVAFAQNRNLCTVAARKEQCPPSAPFFGFMGCAAALVFACLGAAYGTAKSGVGVANMGVLHPDVVMKSIIPVLWLVCLESTVSLSLCFWHQESRLTVPTATSHTLASPRSPPDLAVALPALLPVLLLALLVTLVFAPTLVSQSFSLVSF